MRKALRGMALATLLTFGTATAAHAQSTGPVAQAATDDDDDSDKTGLLGLLGLLGLAGLAGLKRRNDPYDDGRRQGTGSTGTR